MNIHGGTTKPYNDRIHILICDAESRDIYTHGVAVAPEGMGEATAQAIITACFETAKKADLEEWNYDDVLAFLVGEGFSIIQIGIWVEP